MNKTCKQCQSQFEISQTDLNFYDKVSPVFGGKKYSVPPPTLCPSCRQQRRLTWRNERKLYNRKCSMCQKEILSVHAFDKPYPVYCPTCFYSDKWNPLDYAQEYNFSKPFFEQFAELQRKVPIASSGVQVSNENCDYTNLTSWNKSCYLIFAGLLNEHCYYSTYIQRSRDCIDCFFVFSSELCYECIDCYNCYHLLRSRNCQSCSDSQLLDSCTGCKNCFGCINLVNKEFHIFNKPYSKEEYISRIRGLSSSEIEETFKTLYESVPHKYYAGHKNENCSGDHIVTSRNSTSCYDCTDLENCKNCVWMHKSKDCYDCYAWGNTGELGYENHTCGNTFHNVQFCDSCCNNVSEMLYCHACINNSQHLFGCISLQNKSYCILNKQYSKEEYESLMPKIIEHMIDTKEWGEFFPTSISFFAYNETVAQEYFPLTKENALQLGSTWREDGVMASYQGKPPSSYSTIHEVPDSIIKEIFTCDSCQKNYRIIAQELNLYRKLEVPLPKYCFDCRYKHRFQKRNPRHLWSRECAHCHAAIQTTYSPDRPEIVYCEKCYLKTVY